MKKLWLLLRSGRFYCWAHHWPIFFDGHCPYCEVDRLNEEEKRRCERGEIPLHKRIRWEVRYKHAVLVEG